MTLTPSAIRKRLEDAGAEILDHDEDENLHYFEIQGPLSAWEKALGPTKEEVEAVLARVLPDDLDGFLTRRSIVQHLFPPAKHGECFDGGRKRWLAT